MAPMLCVGAKPETLQRLEPQSGSTCVPTRSLGTMRLELGMLFPTVSLRHALHPQNKRGCGQFKFFLSHFLQIAI